MVSSIGATSMPSRESTPMSYLALCADLQHARGLPAAASAAPARRPAGSGRDRAVGLQRQPLGGGVAERDVAGLAGRDAPARRRRGRTSADEAPSVSASKRDDARRARPGDPRRPARRGRARRRRPSVDRLRRLGRCGGPRRGRLGRRAAGARLDDAPREAAELHRLQEVAQHLGVRVDEDEVVQRLGQRRRRNRASPAGARGGSGRRTRSASGGACPA